MKRGFVTRALVCALPSLATAQIATLHIEITEGEEAAHIAGSRSLRPVSVQITDDARQPVAGAAVSFRLPEEGPGGIFPNGLRTELVISDANGRAGVRRLQCNHIPGAFQIRVTAAREQARGGTLVQQYILGEGARLAPKPKSGRRWIAVGLVAAGITGGVAARVARNSTAAPLASVAPAASTMAPVTIGSPVISLGKP